MHKKIIALAGILLLAGLVASSAQINYNDITADKALRDGVVRFHDGQYGEAVFLFQKVLELRPADVLARTWLGRAYYHAGFQDSAGTEWEYLLKGNGGSPALASFVEYLRSLQGLGLSADEDQGFFPVHQVEKGRGIQSFRRPSAGLALADGRTLICSFANNTIAVLDANGRIRTTWRGGLQRYSGPFDLALVGGRRLYASQYLANQIFELDLNGNVIKAFGERGIKPGQLLGPQFLCSDDQAYLYVSDAGNRRIQKFDLEGSPVLTIGERSPAFDGLERPTGVLFEAGSLWVLDARTKAGLPRLVNFDDSGNVLDFIEDDRLAGAEALSLFAPGEYLIPARDTLYLFSTATRQFSVLHSSTRPRTRYTKAVADINGHVTATDFDGETVELFSRLAGMYSGLHVQVQRISARDFPLVRLDLSVSDNLGRPILGLEKDNFTFTEGSKAVGKLEMIGAGYLESRLDVMVLIESSTAMNTPYNQEALRNALKDLGKELPANAAIGIVSAGTIPALEQPLDLGRQNLVAAVETLPADANWAFDKGLRLAVPELVKAPGIRHLIYMGVSALDETAFGAYGLQETLAYLRNNQIRFSLINIQSGVVDPALQFLQRETRGLSRDLYAPRGLGGFGRELADARDGTYSFTYTSAIDSDFGRKYLPIEIGVQLFRKSGRDELGYFAPLKF